MKIAATEEPYRQTARNNDSELCEFSSHKRFPLENISCENFLSGLDLYVDKLLSIGKYLQANKTFVLFICRRYKTRSFFVLIYCITLFAFVESSAK